MVLVLENGSNLAGAYLFVKKMVISGRRERIKILKSMKKIDGVRHVCCAPEDTCNFEYCSLSDDPQVMSHALSANKRLAKDFDKCGLTGDNEFSTFRIEDAYTLKRKHIEPVDAPWNAMLSFNSQLPQCGAVLVTSRHLVTAAHCLQKSGAYTVIFSQVTFETLDTCILAKDCRSEKCRDELKDHCISLKVIEKIRHSAYVGSSKTSNYDIGLLTIERDVDVTPVCLPNVNVHEQIGRQEELILSVWDLATLNAPTSRRATLLPEIKHLTEELRVLPKQECFGSIKHTLSALKMCVGNKEGNSPYVCKGDSGFGVTRKRMNYADELVGLTSYGLRNCDGHAIFTKITGPILRWILNKLYEHEIKIVD